MTPHHITHRARPGLARAAALLTGRRPQEPAVVRRLREQLAEAQAENRRLRLALDYHRDRDRARETREGQPWSASPETTVFEAPAPITPSRRRS